MFVDKFGKPRGPVSLFELKYLIASSQVTPATLGWREGMDNWAVLSQTPAASDAFREVSENERGWFYIDDDNVKQGPLGHALLKQLIMSGQLHGSTLMWRAGQLGTPHAVGEGRVQPLPLLPALCLRRSAHSSSILCSLPHSLVSPELYPRTRAAVQSGDAARPG